MSGYADTKKLIEDTLVGRPAGSLIYPEGHQEMEMALLDYIHNVELMGATPLMGQAFANTQPVQPDDANVAYTASVANDTTTVFANFRDQNGNVISVTTDEAHVALILLFWNKEYWAANVSMIPVVSPEIINNLTTDSVTKALSAAMGKYLNEKKIEAVDIEDPVAEIPNNYYTKAETRALINAVKIAEDAVIEAFKQTIQNQVDNYRPIVIEGDVTNAPDEEDITTDANDLLKLKDRNNLYSEKGYVILRRGSTFAEQVTLQNTIYEIRYDFDLDGETVTIPSGCVLKFNGGSFSNGDIEGTNTKFLDLYSACLHDISLSGTFEKEEVVYSDYFDDTLNAENLLENLSFIGNGICLKNNRSYDIGRSISLPIKKLFSYDKATISFHYTQDTPTEIYGGIVLETKIGEIFGLLFECDFVPSDFPNYSPQSGGCLGLYEQGGAYNGDRSFYIYDCSFSGHYNSSCIVASSVQYVKIINCQFNDIIVEDHIIYFSTSLKIYDVENCIFNVSTTPSASGRGGKIKTRNCSPNIIFKNNKVYNVTDSLIIIEDLTDDTADVLVEGCYLETTISAYYFAGFVYVPGSTLPTPHNLNSIKLLNNRFIINGGTSYDNNYIVRVAQSKCYSVSIENGYFQNCVVDTRNIDKCVLKNCEIVREGLTDFSNEMVNAITIHGVFTSLENCILKGNYKSNFINFLSNTAISKQSVNLINCSFLGSAPALLENRSSCEMEVSVDNCYFENPTFIVRNGSTTGMIVNFNNLNDFKMTSGYPYNYKDLWLNATQGRTVDRPKDGRFIPRGHRYYDTTLHMPIFADGYLSESPYTITWRDAAGNVVE